MWVPRREGQGLGVEEPPLLPTPPTQVQVSRIFLSSAHQALPGSLNSAPRSAPPFLTLTPAASGAIPCLDFPWLPAVPRPGLWAPPCPHPGLLLALLLAACCLAAPPAQVAGSAGSWSALA